MIRDEAVQRLNGNGHIDSAAADGESVVIRCDSVRYPGENLVVFDPAWNPKPMGEPVEVILSEDAPRLREDYFWNQGEPITFPHLPDIESI